MSAQLPKRDWGAKAIFVSAHDADNTDARPNPSRETPISQRRGQRAYTLMPRSSSCACAFREDPTSTPGLELRTSQHLCVVETFLLLSFGQRGFIDTWGLLQIARHRHETCPRTTSRSAWTHPPASRTVRQCMTSCAAQDDWHFAARFRSCASGQHV